MHYAYQFLSIEGEMTNNALLECFLVTQKQQD